MNKITYLFGAGASRHALPIVHEIPERIKKLIDLLESEEFKLDDDSSFDDLKVIEHKTKRELQLELIESLKWMLLESEKHASIDTFAKKLSIKGKYKELNKLKNAMSVFFIFEQAINKPDFRYDTFFASLINNISNLPKNVSILSWNYDYQFELSFSEYSDQQEINSNQYYLSVKSKFGSPESNQGFGIYKLNGTTGFHATGGFHHYEYASNLKVPIKKEFVSQITRSFAAVTYLNNLHSSLSFAWESENAEKTIVAQAIENTKDTYSLVIIGYSFPFFNRTIDRQIIGNMATLKRVYFQAPDAEIIKERFQALKDDLTGVELITKFDTGQFLLPNEL